MTIRAVAVAVVVMLAASACTGDSSPSDAEQSTSGPPRVSATQPPLEHSSADTAAPTQDLDETEAQFGPKLEIRTGPLEATTVADLDALFSSFTTAIDSAVITRPGESGDVRLAWIIGDILRFISSASAADEMSEALVTVTGSEVDGTGLGPGAVYQQLTDRLISWDVPAPPGYAAYKAQLFTLVEPGWAPFFADPEGKIDWRWVTWGDVFIGDRELGDLSGCARGCIPALEYPAVTSAEEGAWYPGEALVFGLEIDGETRAFPKNIMAVHEMVNDTLGGRRFGMPYCTLCGSAQAYFTDELTNDLVLRTSGLLSRSSTTSPRSRCSTHSPAPCGSSVFNSKS
jgi:hypothetical protein